MNLFQNKILKKYITDESENIKVAYQVYSAYFHNSEIQENIRNSKEEQFQEGFLRELFVKVLGYTLNPAPNFNLITEQKNETNSKKADGAILKNGEVIGIIELKDSKTTDLKTVETQAFGYKNNNRKASYVIISNFEKLRFYIDNAIDFIEFNLFTLSFDEFSELWISLAYENIAKDLPKQIKNESVSKEDQITKDLYKDYSRFKRELFADLTEQNPQYDKLLLFKKSQKLLDRLLFIFFAEDRNLLPPNSMAEIIDQWEKLKELDEYRPLYDRFRKYFDYMNTGFKGKKHDIFAYNGGLFKPDDVLDNILISDEILRDNSLRISQYDFDSEVDVNILGHIFENSLTEIEEISQSITKGEEVAAQTSKRKKDGVFYTPRYITTYIVENTLGKLCTKKKIELEIDESGYTVNKKRQKSTKIKLANKLESYRDWLLSLTICDPACGSGAFLNAALDFLIREHQLLDELNAKLYGDALVFPDIENAILENNLYGVDINEESVEIAKLALWLRTAKPQRKLNILSNNIKCGNSLISDPEIAGDKAFDWQKEFPHVFEKGGFDVVIGNPPWGAKVPSKDKVFINENYICKKGELETYVHFIDLIVNKLLKKQGLLGLITPNTWYYLDKYLDLRKFLLNKRIIELIELEKNIFIDAPDIVPGIFIIENIYSDENYQIPTYILKKGNIPSFLIDESIMYSYNIQKNRILEFDNFIFNLKLTEEKALLLHKLSNNSISLKELYNARYGIKTGNNNKFVSKINPDHDNAWKLCIAAASAIKRYSLIWEGDYLNFGEHLAGYSNNSFEKKKILVQYIRKLSMETRIVSTLDKEGCYYPLNNFSFIEEKGPYKLEYLLAIINSKLMNFYFKNTFIDYNIKPKYIEKLPIISLSEDQQPFIEKADQMLSLTADLQTKRQRFLNRLKDNFEGIKITGALEKFDELDFKKIVAELKKQKITLSLKQQDEWEEYFSEYKLECNQLSAQIAETDKTIDKMVYELYGLTEEEIEIVEKK